MNCNMANELIMKYFDKEINDIEAAQLKQHMKNCKECSSQFEELRTVFSVLENQSLLEPPEDFECKVMEKISVIEFDRKKRNDRFFIALYSIGALLTIALSILLGAIFRDIGTIEAVQQFGEYVGAFSGVLFMAYEVIEKIFVITSRVIGAVFQVSILLLRTYYYIFAALLAMLLVIQKMFMNLVRHDSGGMG